MQLTLAPRLHARLELDQSTNRTGQLFVSQELEHARVVWTSCEGGHRTARDPSRICRDSRKSSEDAKRKFANAARLTLRALKISRSDGKRTHAMLPCQRLSD